MRAMLAAVLVIALLGGGYYAYGALFSRPGAVGPAPEGTAVTVSLAELLADPARFGGETVAVAGRVTLTCVTRCWFYLVDADGNVLMVDLAPAGLNLPLGWTQVTVYGTVRVDRGNVILQGTRVESRR